MKPLKFTLQPQEELSQARSGDTVFVRAADGPIVLKAYAASELVLHAVMEQRQKVKAAVVFDQIVITDNSGVGNNVDLLAGLGDFEVSGSVSAEIVQPTSYTGSGDQSIANAVTDTIAARSDRHEITVQADDGNSGPLFLRDSDGNAFAKLAAGGSMTITGEAELQVRNDSGGPQTYRYLEVRG